MDAISLPPFPTEVFPTPIKDLVQHQAAVYQINHDFPGMLALYVCSISLKTKFEINVKYGWKEPLNLYTAILHDHTLSQPNQLKMSQHRLVQTQ